MVTQPIVLPSSMTPALAAEQLGLRPETVRRHLRRGELRGIKLGTRWHVFPPEGFAEAASRWNIDGRREVAEDVVVHLLEDELRQLRDQLQAADFERAELRQLLAQAQAIIARLVVGPGAL